MLWTLRRSSVVCHKPANEGGALSLPQTKTLIQRESWFKNWWSSGAVLDLHSPAPYQKSRWGATCVWFKSPRNNTGSCSRWALCLLSLVFISFSFSVFQHPFVFPPSSSHCYSVLTWLFLAATAGWVTIKTALMKMSCAPNCSENQHNLIMLTHSIKPNHSHINFLITCFESKMNPATGYLLWC